MKTQKYNIADRTGRVLYTNLVRSARIQGYDWNDNHGHVTDSLLKFEGWTVIAI